MTCPMLLRRPPAATDHLGELASWLRRDDALSQFARFVVVGGVSTAFYAVLYVSLPGLGYLPAHLIATAGSTILANECHRRLTFHADDRVHWFTAQWEAGGVALVGAVVSSAGLGWLHSAGTVAVWLQIALVIAVTALIGLLRFIALRWIFRPRALARS